MPAPTSLPPDQIGRVAAGRETAPKSSGWPQVSHRPPRHGEISRLAGRGLGGFDQNGSGQSVQSGGFAGCPRAVGRRPCSGSGVRLWGVARADDLDEDKDWDGEDSALDEWDEIDVEDEEDDSWLDDDDF